MGDEEKLVAIISPWERLSDLVKRKFRVESLPTEKKVMVWRDDLQSDQELEAELKRIGINSVDVRKRRVTGRWQDIQ